MTTRTARPAPSPALQQNPIVAVLRAHHARDYAPVIDALLTGGIRSIELTLSTGGVFETLPGLLDRFGTDADIGIGTITTPEETARALDGGASFVVTPVTDTDIVAACAARNVPVYPGGLTPTELLAGWKAGATAVKIFPASTVGPYYLAQLRGPFPDLEVIPSGGVGIPEAPGWITAGALAVSVGGPLLQDAFTGGDAAALVRRAQQLTDTVAQAVSARSAGAAAGGAR
ncbi:bifunctional 4-hydroxy-2-oxoglutarate aldolase/2-dehydro-3-deoxy-phosphogluconate aldolase [Arthrobacter globiformis]|uniref:bifunctional 4-hydroxy-2-oxoglutarate aldolase/2-dehydro-3-deoxy-phosphogluconate aldolase n=1 Tax=Arthrobacter globiformis TaxID=1665 RepID=UPI002788CBBC|nr:bifunctional 4-hydroxy-2-oxoglutarate aldolase/2-dehydro-3-deoxy-phosphogluconate aldolase [Arthrobacter globiformis]MDQ0867486.1 2-dehydro-3-deoxyphosphogluconate aldolase/(4S)-4-hydroxy-2-oxoglutarate aldolase [Arthrobacter globiformis]